MDFLACNLLLVSGKGGVGKTAIASALALCAAQQGRRTLLAGYARQDERHPFFDTRVSYEPSQVADKLFLARVDARLALKEYVNRKIPLAVLYERFLDSHTLAHFTDATPGFDEIMSLGKLYDHVSGGEFDLVVFDGPASGHMKTLLRVPSVTTAAVRTGPVHLNALKIQTLLENPVRTRVVGVTLAEEMALREVSELLAFCRDELRLHTAPVIVNKLAASSFTGSEIQALQSLLTRVGKDSAPVLSAALKGHIQLAMQQHGLVTLQQQCLQSLHDARPEVVEVPRVVDHSFASRQQAAAIQAVLAQQLDL